MSKKTVSNELPPFEQAVAELEQIVRRLEQGGNSLEDDLTDYGKAIKLIKQCHTRLAEAERSVQLLSGLDSDGNPILKPFEASDSSNETLTLEHKLSDRSRRRTARQDDSPF